MPFLSFDGALAHPFLFPILRCHFPDASCAIWVPGPGWQPWKQGSVIPALTQPLIEAAPPGMLSPSPGTSEGGEAEQEGTALPNTAPGAAAPGDGALH